MLAYKPVTTKETFRNGVASAHPHGEAMASSSRTTDRLREDLERVHHLIDELVASASRYIQGIEEVARDGEETYRRLVESAGDVLWVFDLDLGYTYISPSVKRLRGYTVEEAMGLRLEEVLTPESMNKARSLFERERRLALSGHRYGPDWSLTDEFEMVRKDGSTFPAEVTISLIYDDSGRIRGITGITRDISERKRHEEELRRQKELLEEEVRRRTAELTVANERLHREVQERSQAEKALRESMERLDIHFSLANDVLFSYDGEFRVLSVSPNVERVLGYRPEELVGKTFLETNALHPDSYETALQNASRILSGSPVYSSVYKFVKKDGSVGYGEVSGVPCMRDGRVYAVTTIARDVTERIEMAEAIRESEENYRLTLEAMPDAVCILKKGDLTFVYVNDAFCRITGHFRDEVLGSTLERVGLAVSEEDLAHCVDLVRSAHGPGSVERPCRRKDGSTFDAMISASPVRYSGSDCAVMVIKDVTAHKQLERERTKLELQSLKLESLATLSRGIAHDFNNILTTLMGYTRMAIKELRSPGAAKEADAARKDLEEAMKAAAGARHLVDQLLAFSRHGETAHMLLDLSSLIEKSLETLQPTFPSSITIQKSIEPGCMVVGDPLQIHQVLANLCVNAAQAMAKAQGVIEVGLERTVLSQPDENLDLAPGPYIKLSVRDTGPGMSEKVSSRLFDPYFTTSWKGKGSGLGLSVVYGVVRGHGGAVAFRSARDAGTVFDVYLPEHTPGRQDLPKDTCHAPGEAAARVLDLDADPKPPRPEKPRRPTRMPRTNNT